MRRDYVERVWANELCRLVAVIRDYRLDAICIEYDDLVLSPEETVERLSSFVGISLDAAYIDRTCATMTTRYRSGTRRSINECGRSAPRAHPKGERCPSRRWQRRARSRVTSNASGR